MPTCGLNIPHVTGHHAADLPLEDFTNPDVPGKWVVLKTNPIDASVPVRTWLVRLIRVTNEVDPLTATNITRLEWEEAQATPFELELETLVVRGNIVPATAGETLEAFFEIEPSLQRWSYLFHHHHTCRQRTPTTTKTSPVMPSSVRRCCSRCRAQSSATSSPMDQAWIMLHRKFA